MADRPIRIPGPDHPITVEPNPNRVVVTLAGKVIADTREALTLREASYPPAQYVPRQDVDMAAIERPAMTTYCPYKGDAAYFSIRAGGDRAVDAIWTYAVDILRIEEGLLAEHWNVLQDEANRAGSVSGFPMFGDVFPVEASRGCGGVSARAG